MPTQEDPEEKFGFEEGDQVLVRVRENGTTGNIVAKFEAECETFIQPGIGASPKARFDLPWGELESTCLRTYEAEFEVLDEDENTD